MKTSAKKHIKVLITGAGTATCQSIIKAFRNQGELDVHITTIDMNPECAGRYLSDAFYVVHPATDPEFVPTLLAICEREQIQLLIPVVDDEFMKLARNRPRFAELGCFVAISSERTIDICTDKLKTYDFFVKHGVPTAWTRQLSTMSDREIDTLSYPVFVKPRVGRATLHAARVDSPQALRVHVSRGGDFVVQEYLEGQEYTIDLLNDLSGHTVGVVPRARIETKSGVSYKGRTEKNQDMMKLAQFIAEALGITGHANIQCFKTTAGIKFTEINPRYAGAMVCSLAAGFNSPLLLAKLVLGEEVPPQIGRFREGILMLRFWDEVFVDQQGRPFRLNRV